MMCDTWKDLITTELNKPYAISMREFVANERAKFTVYPKQEDVFEAFKLTPFESVKVVVVGQDPYHGPGQAHGLAFSVKNGKPPPSLVNIYKEISTDVGEPKSVDGDLTHWAEQGVFLLNTSLTVREGEPGSHANCGWWQFTSAILQSLSDKKSHLIFVMWGKHAASLLSCINTAKHTVLTAPHPSPFSANKGFFGCKHFSKINELLTKHSLQTIRW